MNNKVLLQTDFKDLKLFRRGKVRDVYDLEDKLLIVSTDRISCFDVVLPCGIPYKGKVLTSISAFWFDYIKEIVPHHLITQDVEKYPDELKKYKADLTGRSMLVLKTKPLPVECIVRGYLSGSGWNEYKQNQSICGISLPSGLRQSDKLPEAIFTPSTKADLGHDQNVNQKYISDLVGSNMAEQLKKISLEVYKRASAHALGRGIIIADTKFEFGIHNNRIIIIDEVLTPDSSRFWPLENYKSGEPCISFDKQFVRDYLETLDWEKTPPAPNLPIEIIEKTKEKYLEAYHKLTGNELL
ncbi:MAG: phosphoribosylaminoimidazolesuccinocarboxamide synthase [Candidatus Omnitrophica bacterium]|nr:phosphoribosylaminoimidazolesuccinocarboxamide synthase [Candidatus Omnitrophota bacterium]